MNEMRAKKNGENKTERKKIHVGSFALRCNCGSCWLWYQFVDVSALLMHGHHEMGFMCETDAEHSMREHRLLFHCIALKVDARNPNPVGCYYHYHLTE